MKTLEIRIFLLLSMIYRIDNKSMECPIFCDCEKIRDEHHMICNQGGIDDQKLQFILKHTPNDINALEIVAPKDKPNQFSLSRDIAKFEQLHQLSLINCNLASLGRHIFRGMSQLVLLNLQKNNIEFVSGSSFSGLNNLEILDLSHNKLQHRLPTGTFRRLTNLRSLSIAHNNMRHFSTNFLSGLSMLDTLILDGNKATSTEISALFADLPNITRLELNYCCLKELEKLHFEKVPALKRLGLGWNDLRSLRTICNHLKPLRSLNSLDLSGNRLTNVPPCSFCEFHINTLSLAHNNLGGHFETEQQLNSHSFQDIPLVELDLSFNNFKSFNSSMLRLVKKTIRILHLSGNPLNHIDNNIIKDLKLTALHVARIGSQVKIGVFPPEFDSLTLLNLSGNGLIKLCNQIVTLPMLTTLDVSHNKLTLLKHRIVAWMATNTKTVYLNDNPWDCQCGILDLQMALSMVNDSKRKEALKYDRIRCKTPSTMQNKRITALMTRQDCVQLFEAMRELTRASQMGVLLIVLLLLAVALYVIFRANEQRYKGSYRTSGDSKMKLNPNNLD